MSYSLQLLSLSLSLTLIFSLCITALNEFLKISIDHIKYGDTAAAQSKYSKAASALNVSLPSLTATIHVLSHVLLEAARKSVNENELQLSIEDAASGGLKLPPATIERIKHAYSTHYRDLRSLLTAHTHSLTLPHYHNLEWRVDVEIGSRLLRQQTRPMIVLQLDTKDERGETVRQYMQMDYAQLEHTVAELEQAVKQASSKHARRILRYVK